jgi:glycine hydroxymethyltransferase
MNEDAEFVVENVKAHHKWFQSCLPMIASENLISPVAREMLISDFCDRYAEGHPGKRYYQGCIYIDKVELKCIELAKRLFKCSYADVRATSGTVANIGIFKALAKPGDTITALNTAEGAHISHAKFGGAGVRGLEVVNYPFDSKNMNIDVDGTIKLIKEIKPKIALFGQSVYLFPTPLKEIAETVHDIGSSVVYDGAHVLGLIAGGKFQDPLREGADVITGSTHKTLPGPQGGIVLSDHKGDTEEDKKFLKRLDSGIFPGVVSNHHLHHMAAKAVAFAEHIEFGKEYSEQIIGNAKALAQTMYELGFDVFCEHLGFTESHQIVVGVGEGKGKWAAENLEKAGIIVNMNMIPGDTKPLSPSGLRIGVQELTRIGVKENDMKDVARFFKKVLIDKAEPEDVNHEVAGFRKGFNIIHYCFKGGEAHKYYEIT